MKHIRHYLCCLLLLLPLWQAAAQLRVACVGNSVTFGATIPDRARDSYPSQLQRLLGAGYRVGNFGHSGATVLRKGHKPYWEKPELQQALDFAPDLVVIHLGLNDVGLNNWMHKGDFERDYLELIDRFRSLPTRPKVWVCRLSPGFSSHHWFEQGMRENKAEAQQMMERLARKAGVPLIDLHEPLYRFPEYYNDALHPDGRGAGLIAAKVYAALTGDFGGLRLPAYYADGMLLQRRRPVRLHGWADAGRQVRVLLDGQERLAMPDSCSGAWSVEFPPMEGGLGHRLQISTPDSTLLLQDVRVGELWLAAGQSNMAFSMQEAKDAARYLADSLNGQVSLLRLQPKAHTYDRPYDSLELATGHADAFFALQGWQTADDRQAAASFSAVGYAFAHRLQRELGVPVGLVQVAVGGAPTESFISRQTLEGYKQGVEMLNHPERLADAWVSGRQARNLAGAKGHRHAYQPTFLFDAGILPLQGMDIGGVIWYQGESNADNPQQHAQLFGKLLQDWRAHWGREDLPFLYVQLSSMERPSWPAFRDSQRRLLRLPHTAMAVSHDLGHPTDVHPTDKWPLGGRLAQAALSQVYGRGGAPMGPLFDYANVQQHGMWVAFGHARGLRTLDGASIRGFELAGADGVFRPARARLRKGGVWLQAEGVQAPRYVRYAWQPYTDANLCNAERLPASTFTTFHP